MMMKMNKDKFEGLFGIKLFFWKNIIERFYSSWLEEYAKEFFDNNYERVELTTSPYDLRDDLD
tara:strand:+ start:12781 stop:12969 length:189 start_codon:yes stop_codon:yes gene_type:complete